VRELRRALGLQRAAISWARFGRGGAGWTGTITAR
jgi:hypothetical protein